MAAESAYELAERLHAAGMEAVEGKSFAECRELGVQRATFNPNGTEKLHADGEINGRHAYQTFSRGRNNNYYLYTVFTEPGGEIVPYRFTPTSEASPEAIATLGTSFFAQRLG